MTAALLLWLMKPALLAIDDEPLLCDCDALGPCAACEPRLIAFAPTSARSDPRGGRAVLREASLAAQDRGRLAEGGARGGTSDRVVVVPDDTEDGNDRAGSRERRRR